MTSPPSEQKNIPYNIVSNFFDAYECWALKTKMTLNVNAFEMYIAGNECWGYHGQPSDLIITRYYRSSTEYDKDEGYSTTEDY